MKVFIGVMVVLFVMLRAGILYVKVCCSTVTMVQLVTAATMLASTMHLTTQS
jgi:hypothetical protein